jgi:hypothetical protein
MSDDDGILRCRFKFPWVDRDLGTCASYNCLDDARGPGRSSLLEELICPERCPLGDHKRVKYGIATDFMYGTWNYGY